MIKTVISYPLSYVEIESDGKILRKNKVSGGRQVLDKITDYKKIRQFLNF